MSVTKANVVEGPEGIGLLAGDHIQAQYSFPNGVSGFFASKRGMGGSPTRFGLQVLGSRGIIELQSGYLKPAFILQDSSWSPGRTGRRSLTRSRLSSTAVLPACSRRRLIKMPDSCAIASMINTPGMIGRSG